MRFGFITLGKHVPSTRFRFEPYFPFLRERGHRCHMWMSYPSVYEQIDAIGWRMSQAVKRLVRYRQYASATLLRPDAIYLERGCLNDDSLDLDRLFRRSTPRLILDVDDGIFLEKPEKIDALIKMSDHCVVSNELIGEYVAQRHAHVSLLPTAVSMARYRPKPALTDATSPPRRTIGWIGSIPNMPFLKVCAEALRKLAQTRDFRLLIVGPSPAPLAEIDLTGVQVEFRRWSIETEIDDLHEMDIGLMPLPTGSDWMLYKAATKLVQYLAIGIPAVASPIGVNRIILEEQEVGLAAASTDEWHDALALLLDDPQRGSALGRAGRELVSRRYSIEANAPLLEQVLTGQFT